MTRPKAALIVLIDDGEAAGLMEIDVAVRARRTSF